MRSRRGSDESGLGEARAAAARIVAAVLDEGRSLDRALAGLAPRGAGRALVAELAYGTLRWQPQLAALVGALLRRPLKGRDRDLHALLLVGAYQLVHLDLPAPQAVSRSAEAARALGKPWAVGMVNGLLRALLRRREELLAGLEATPAARHAHPDWLLARWREQWPADWEGIAAAGNRRPPMTLRVNRLQGTREAYLERLRAAAIEAEPAAHSPAGVVLGRAVEVAELPGFSTGAASVQDLAAQLAAPLLEPAAGMRVLDACAAPGGKTGHLLECCGPGADLIALDRDPERLRAVEDNLARLGLSCTVRAGDAAAPAQWWDGRAFERILLDAPCSGSGVIRRHPDIKLLRRESDIETLARAQAELLRALWSVLAPGGMLLYATCSVLQEENEGQVISFLDSQPDARERPIEASWGRPRPAGRQILSGEDEMDGFYYARLVKVAA